MNTPLSVGPISEHINGADLSWLIGLRITSPPYYWLASRDSAYKRRLLSGSVNKPDCLQDSLEQQSKQKMLRAFGHGAFFCAALMARFSLGQGRCRFRGLPHQWPGKGLSRRTTTPLKYFCRKWIIFPGETS